MPLNNDSSSTLNHGLISADLWCEQVGISPATRWRWERRRWLKTILIANRRYIRAEDITEFLSRASAGEFAQEPKTPKRKVSYGEQ